MDMWIVILVCLWVAAMIATPIIRWTADETAFHAMITVGVLMQAGATGIALVRTTGFGSVLRILLPLLFLAWLAEFIGCHTGFPFGKYTYTEILQPQVGGVPLLVPIAWLSMLPSSWAVADLILKNRGFPTSWSERLARAAVAALAFTTWDLFIDPQMVLWGLWHWARPGIYFGIPLTNYLGWLLVSFLITLLLAPTNLPSGPLLIIYAVTWFLTFFGQLFFLNLPGPALVGFASMGGILFWLYKKSGPMKSKPT